MVKREAQIISDYIVFSTKTRKHELFVSLTMNVLIHPVVENNETAETSYFYYIYSSKRLISVIVCLIMLVKNAKI